MASLSNAFYARSPTYQNLSYVEQLNVIVDILVDADVKHSPPFIDSRPDLDSILACDECNERAQRTAWAYCAYISLVLKMGPEDPLWEHTNMNYYDNMRKLIGV